MLASLRFIYQCLRKHDAKIFIKDAEHDKVTDICVMKEKEKPYDIEILYLTTYKKMCELEELPVNLLVLCDSISDTVYFNAATNVIMLVTDESPEAVIDYIVQNTNERNDSVMINIDFLLEAACQGDMDVFLKEVYHIWGNPIFVHDSSFKKIAREMGNLTEEERIEFKNENEEYLTKETIEHVYKQKYIERAYQGKKPFFVDKSLYGHKMLMIPIFKSNIIVALVFIVSVHSDFNERDLELAQIIGKLFSLMIQNDKKFLYPLGSLHDQFFKELVSGSYTDTATVLHRASYIDLKSTIRIGVIGCPYSDLNKNKLLVLVSEIKSILDVKMAMFYMDRIVIIISDDDSSYLNEYQGMRLGLFLDSNNLLAAFSHEFSDILLGRQHYLQAMYLFDMLSDKKEHSSINYFEDHTIQCLIHNSDNLAPKKELLNPVIIKIMEYDAKFNANLLETLRVYMFNLKHINDTAAKLNIHRNTLFYRLKLLKEMFNLDLDDAKSVFNIMFSFFILGEMNKEN